MARPTTHLLAFFAVAAALLFPTSALAQLPTETGSEPLASTVVVRGEHAADKTGALVGQSVASPAADVGVGGDGVAWGEIGIGAGVVGVFAMGLLLIALTLFTTNKGNRRPVG